jgi:type II secretory ATPase GspE/PulE/Tfp pilus assembly ATPase PilB-like protein
MSSNVDNLLREILHSAISERASDVHIEPFESFTRIRFRIDGILEERRCLESQLHCALILRLKILSGIPVDCPEMPQDGKWLYEGNGCQIDVRISLIPFLYGEGAVLRILTNSLISNDLLSLGIDACTSAALRSTVRSNNGLLLVSGPTGCGKSTTIHALLRGLNDGTRKIITVEDPVEYTSDGIQSVQVNERNGLDFENVLRAVLRQSPDVLFVGEIRDERTAAIAIQASLTGHFVCSTLHCNDSIAAIARLRQLGVSDHLMSATIRGVFSQRLVRKLCSKCKMLQVNCESIFDNDRICAFSAVGCCHCNNVGYRGQTALYEWLPLQNVRITDKNITSAQLSPSMKTCAKQKILSGETSIDEVYAAIFCDGHC